MDLDHGLERTQILEGAHLIPQVADLKEDPQVRYIDRSLVSMGHSPSVEFAIRFQDLFIPSIEAELDVTFLPYESSNDDVEAVYVAITEKDGLRSVATFALRTAPPQPGDRRSFVRVERLGVWLHKPQALSLQRDSKFSSIVMQMEPKPAFCYYCCLASGSAAGCTASAIGCVYSSVAYLHCVGIGCGGSIVGSGVGCAVAWIFAS